MIDLEKFMKDLPRIRPVQTPKLEDDLIEGSVALLQEIYCMMEYYDQIDDEKHDKADPRELFNAFIKYMGSTIAQHTVQYYKDNEPDKIKEGFQLNVSCPLICPIYAISDTNEVEKIDDTTAKIYPKIVKIEKLKYIILGLPSTEEEEQDNNSFKVMSIAMVNGNIEQKLDPIQVEGEIDELLNPHVESDTEQNLTGNIYELFLDKDTIEKYHPTLFKCVDETVKDLLSKPNNTNPNPKED